MVDRAPTAAWAARRAADGASPPVSPQPRSLAASTIQTAAMRREIAWLHPCACIVSMH